MDQRGFSFMEAVKAGFQNHSNFEGRASRSEYWWFYLAVCLLTAVAQILAVFIGICSGSALFAGLFLVSVLFALIMPSLSATARRLHDVGKAATWILIGLVPFVGGIVLLYFTLLPSQPYENEYGPVPGVDCDEFSEA